MGTLPRALRATTRSATSSRCSTAAATRPTRAGRAPTPTTRPSLLEPGRPSNRLTSTTTGATAETYSSGGDGYDAHGNMLRMPHLQLMRVGLPRPARDDQRQAGERRRRRRRQHQGERTYYVYDAPGSACARSPRDRTAPRQIEERIYLGGFEIFRSYDGGRRSVTLERETLHVMDDQQRIALVETRTRAATTGVAGAADPLPARQPPRLGQPGAGRRRRRSSPTRSTTPYGSTSYQAVRSQTETPKRYRYTGQGARRGDRPLLPRRALLRAVWGAGSAPIRPGSRRAQPLPLRPGEPGHARRRGRHRLDRPTG